MISQLTNACRSVGTSWWTAAAMVATGVATGYFLRKSKEQDQGMTTLFNATLASGLQFLAALAITGYRLYNSRPQKLGPPPPGLPFITQEERVLNVQLAYSDLLVGCRARGAIDEAVNTFQHMDQLNIPRNVYHYAIMIDLFAIARQPERAYSYYQAMQQNGIRPNNACYGALLKAYILQKNHMMVGMICLEMEQKNVKLNRITCQQLCQWYGSQGDQAKAAHYFTLSNDRCVKNEHYEIDCHAMTKEGAFFACKPHLDALKEDEFLFIITGRGRHSTHGRGFFDLRDNLQQKIEENYPNLCVRVNSADMGQLEVDVKPTFLRPALGPSA